MSDQGAERKSEGLRAFAQSRSTTGLARIIHLQDRKRRLHSQKDYDT